jgi:hypothetical protein
MLPDAATRESPTPFFETNPIGPCQTEGVAEEGVVDKGEGEKVDGGQGIVARNDVCNGASSYSDAA